MKDNYVLYSGGYDSTVLFELLKKKGLDPKIAFVILQHFDHSFINEADAKFVRDRIMKGFVVDKCILGYADNRLDDAYTPCRNINLVLGLVNKIYPKPANIYIGLIKTQETYSDTTKEWVEAVNAYLKVEFGDKYKVFAPFIDKTKDEVYRIGCSLKVKLEDTFSCNFADEKGNSCGKCGDCEWRNKQKFPIYATKDEMEELLCLD